MSVLGLKCKNCGTIHEYFRGQLIMQLDMDIMLNRDGSKVARASNISIETQGSEPSAECPTCGNSGDLTDIIKQVFGCDGCMKTIKSRNKSYCSWHGCNFCNTCFEDDIRNKYCKACSECSFCELYKSQGEL